MCGDPQRLPLLGSRDYQQVKSGRPSTTSSASKRPSNAGSPPQHGHGHIRGQGRQQDYQYGACAALSLLLVLRAAAAFISEGMIRDAYATSSSSTAAGGGGTSSMSRVPSHGISAATLSMAERRTFSNKADDEPEPVSWPSLRESLVSVDVCGRNASAANVTIGGCAAGAQWPKRGMGPLQLQRQEPELCPWPSIFERLLPPSTTFNGSFEESSSASSQNMTNQKRGQQQQQSNGNVLMGFVNFTAASARRLLRGRTIFINGDSTSRRLMRSLCHFLQEDSTSDEQRHTHTPAQRRRRNRHMSSSSRKGDERCNLRRVLDSDIMLVHNPTMQHTDAVNWLVEKGGLRKSYNSRRNHHRGSDEEEQEGGHKLAGHAGNAEMLQDVPPSEEPRSVHIFHPVAGTWRSCTQNLWSYSDGWRAASSNKNGTTASSEATCGMDRFINASTHRDSVEAAACDLVDQFCPRFENAARRQLPMDQKMPTTNNGSSGASGGRTSGRGKKKKAAGPVHMHGLTNVLASGGPDDAPSGNNPDGNNRGDEALYRRNDWMLAVARATHRSSGSSCKTDLNEKSTSGAEQSAIEYGQLSASRRYIRPQDEQAETKGGEGGGGISVSCGHHDQTTWMLAEEQEGGRRGTAELNDGSPVGTPGAVATVMRHKCMPSDGRQGIRIANEYGRLMRVQLLLNQILRTEEEWDNNAGRSDVLASPPAS